MNPNFLKKKEAEVIEPKGNGAEDYKAMEQKHVANIKQAIALLQEILPQEEEEAGEKAGGEMNLKEALKNY